MKNTKKLNRNLRVTLTREELLETGKSLADATAALAAIEDDKKRVTSDFKAKADAKQAEISVASQAISTGYWIKEVECTAHMDMPKKGQKTIVRDDTGEHVGVEPMSRDDMQVEMEIE